MAAMSTNNSTAAQGFSVYQPELGASLQWLPALGTPQLDDLLDAYLPGPASIKDKRAAVAMDFFEFSRLTGQNFKYYPVFIQAAAAAYADSPATASPASSGMYDSGYGSAQLMASPVVSDLSASPWNKPLSTTSSPSVRSASHFGPSRRPAAAASSSSSRRQLNDFSDLPGMKIMTRDGRDVTNSSSRGCKTKEQRDHAHLMRIMKACDACRRKKIRCDPSHRRAASAKPEPSRPVKAAYKAHSQPLVQPPVPSPETVFVGSASQHLDLDMLLFDSTPPALEPWEEFVQYEDQLTAVDPIPFDYNFFTDPEGHFSSVSTSPVSSSSTSASDTSPRQPQTPVSPGASPGTAPPGVLDDHQKQQQQLLAAVSEPALGYLDRSGPAHEYVDFALYSPASSFVDDDEELFVQRDIGAVYHDQHAQRTGVAHADQYYSSPRDEAAAPDVIVDPQSLGGGYPAMPDGSPSNAGGLAGHIRRPHMNVPGGVTDARRLAGATRKPKIQLLTETPLGGFGQASRTVNPSQTSSSRATVSATMANLAVDQSPLARPSASASSGARQQSVAAKASHEQAGGAVATNAAPYFSREGTQRAFVSSAAGPSERTSQTQTQTTRAATTTTAARNRAAERLLAGGTIQVPAATANVITSRTVNSSPSTQPSSPVVATAAARLLAGGTRSILASTGAASVTTSRTIANSSPSSQLSTFPVLARSVTRSPSAQPSPLAATTMDSAGRTSERLVQANASGRRLPARQQTQAGLGDVVQASTLGAVLAGSVINHNTASTQSWRLQSVTFAALILVLARLQSLSVASGNRGKHARYQSYSSVDDVAGEWNVLVTALVCVAYLAVLWTRGALGNKGTSLAAPLARTWHRCREVVGHVGDQGRQLSSSSGLGFVVPKRWAAGHETRQPFLGTGADAAVGR